MGRCELDNCCQMRRDNNPLCDRHTIDSSFSSGQPLKAFQIARLKKKTPNRGETTSVPYWRPSVWAAICLFSLLFAPAFTGRAQNPPPTEYQIKAAFVYNFVKFVDWPMRAFASPSSPIVIGVLGKNAFGDDLEQIVTNKVIRNRPLQFEAFHSVTEATNCQVLFISASEDGHFHEILGALDDRSVLTVSESSDFIKAGGMINFVIVDRKVRFQINNSAARKAGLKISSNLLSLAVP